MNYLYVIDEKVRDELLKKQFKLMQTLNTSIKTWIFESNPSLFDSYEAEIKSFEQQKKCFISNKLMMMF